MKVLFLLITAHYLFDFGFQNDFIAKFKVPRSAEFWPHILFAHCAMQGLGVYLATNSVKLGVAEICVHFLIDYEKGLKRLTINQDQALHITAKLVWFVLLTKGLV